MGRQDHWETVYRSKASDAVSWYRPHLDTSLEWIARVAPDRASAIIDIGGGASTLVDDLLTRGYRHIAVLDIAEPALDIARQRLGPSAQPVDWRVGDITSVTLPARHYDIWHDRAVLHFLAEASQRDAYLQQLRHALKPGGHAIIATFGPDGPQQCSNLPVVRYDAAALQALLGTRFTPVDTRLEGHQTPFGTTQQFLYGCYRLD